VQASNKVDTPTALSAQKAEPTSTILQDATSWLKPLGKIRDADGIERLYFKNTHDNSVIRVRIDGTEENNIRLIVKDSMKTIRINGILYQITGDF
jgi:hypothetical protein